MNSIKILMCALLTCASPAAQAAFDVISSEIEDATSTPATRVFKDFFNPPEDRPAEMCERAQNVTTLDISGKSREDYRGPDHYLLLSLSRFFPNLESLTLTHTTIDPTDLPKTLKNLDMSRSGLLNSENLKTLDNLEKLTLSLIKIPTGVIELPQRLQEASLHLVPLHSISGLSPEQPLKKLHIGLLNKTDENLIANENIEYDKYTTESYTLDRLNLGGIHSLPNLNTLEIDGNNEISLDLEKNYI